MAPRKVTRKPKHTSHSSASVSNKGTSKLLTYHEVPSWVSYNPHILTGYRSIQHSYLGCVRSLLYIHNETGNIMTHVIATLTFLIIWIVSFYLYIPILKSSTIGDYFAIGVFIFGSITCLSLSFLFHLFCCHSLETSREWNKLDYIGIVVQIVTAFFPPVYYGFHCHSHWQAFYLSSITIFGAFTVSVTASNKYCQEEYKFIRTCLFVGLGFFGVFPVIHATIIEGVDFAIHAMSALYIITMGAIYLSGAYIYVNLIPEKWFPGYFDIWFNSHQIFHVLVFIGPLVHWVGAISAHNYWHTLTPMLGDAICTTPTRDLIQLYLSQK